MSLFGSLFGKKKPTYYSCKVSMNRPVLDTLLINGIISNEYIVITFFKSTTDRLIRELKNDLLSEHIILADKINSVLVQQKIKNFLAQSGRKIVLAERHPLSSHENLVGEKLSENGIPLPIIAFASLDDALLQMFGGERVKELMKRMGMAEEELIEHSMIEKSIENAQDKIAKKVFTESRTNSPEEWFQLNFRKEN